MFNRHIFIIITVTLVSLKAALEIGDECALNNGSIGVCTEAIKCQEALQLIKRRVKPKLCRFEADNIITVCCGDKNATKIKGARSTKACKRWQDAGSISFDRFFILGGGGEPALTSEFPHMAALGFVVKNGSVNETNWNCGGSLISLRFVLTAAHCLNSLEDGPVRYVRVGDLNLKLLNDTAAPQDFRVVKTYRNPLYKRRTRYHDIALIELDRDATITEYVRPACLYIHNDNPQSLIATGWGLLSYYGNSADHLQKLILQHVNNTECRKYYSEYSQRLSEGIVEKYQICAGYPGRDTCQGDSGGPLQVLTPMGFYNIHGVTAFGKACLLTNSPGVYTRVANYIEWIEDIVWPLN